MKQFRFFLISILFFCFSAQLFAQTLVTDIQMSTSAVPNQVVVNHDTIYTVTIDMSLTDTLHVSKFHVKMKNQDAQDSTAVLYEADFTYPGTGSSNATVTRRKNHAFLNMGNYDMNLRYSFEVTGYNLSNQTYYPYKKKM